MKTKLLLILLLIGSASFRPETKSWTALGDSITYLNDHPDETGNRVTKGYMTRVTESLSDVHYINQGHNGWSAVGIAKAIDSLGLQKSDIYTVFLGTNDWGQGLPIGDFKDYLDNTGTDTFYGAYRVIVNKLVSLNPKAKIILITPMQRQDFIYIADSHNNHHGSYREEKGQLLSQFADAINLIAAHENYPVIDLYYKSGMNLKNLVKFKRMKDSISGQYQNFKYPDFVGRKFNPDADEYPYPPEAINNTFDGLHPSDKGNQVIADMLVKAMAKY